MVRLHAVTFLAAEGDDLMASEYVFLHLKVLLPGLWKVAPLVWQNWRHPSD